VNNAERDLTNELSSEIATPMMTEKLP